MAKKQEQEEKGLPHSPKLATAKTPWNRHGYPGNSLWGKTTWGLSVANVGAQPERVLDDEQLIDYGARWGGAPVGHIEERAFIQHWDYQNNGSTGRGVYGMMWFLLDDATKALVKDEEDLLLVQKVAATFAQWLGTNVGRSFIEESRRLTASEVERLRPKIEHQKKLLQAIGELDVHDHEIAREKGVTTT